MSKISIKYGNYTFNPSPNIEYSTEIKRSDAGYMIGTVDKFTLNGVLFNHEGGVINDTGVTTASNSFNNLLTSLSGLKDALEKDYEELLIECSDGNTRVYKSDKNVTYVDSFDFTNSSDNLWLQLIDYSISISVYNTGTVVKSLIDYISDNGYLVSNFIDTYSINTNTEPYYAGTSNRFGPILGESYPSYTVTRNISANGIHAKNRSALDNAKKFVSGLAISDKHGLNKILSGLFIYDRSTQINQDPINGTYGINDTFSAYSGTSGWTDTYTITTTFDQNLKKTVVIDGEVKGLLQYDNDNNFLYDRILDDTFSTTQTLQGYRSTKWNMASGGFYNYIHPNILNRATNSWYNNTGVFKGVSPPSGKYSMNSGINPMALSVSIQHDFAQGSISYSYTYDSRPLVAISGAISENLDIDDSFSLRSYVFPEVFFGSPIPQDMGTYSASKRSVAYTATFPKSLSVDSSVVSEVKDFVKQFDPKKLTPLTSTRGSPGFYSRVVNDQETYDLSTGKYSYNIAWEYEKAFFNINNHQYYMP